MGSEFRYTRFTTNFVILRSHVGFLKNHNKDLSLLRGMIVMFTQLIVWMIGQSLAQITAPGDEI